MALQGAPAIFTRKIRAYSLFGVGKGQNLHRHQLHEMTEGCLMPVAAYPASEFVMSHNSSDIYIYMTAPNSLRLRLDCLQKVDLKVGVVTAFEVPERSGERTKC